MNLGQLNGTTTAIAFSIGKILRFTQYISVLRKKGRPSVGVIAPKPAILFDFPICHLNESHLEGPMMVRTTDRLPAHAMQLLEQVLPQHVLAGYMRYEKIRTLGCGGKAEVFLCRDVTLGREVAVKVLHPTLLESPVEQQMLVCEARIMAALAHAGIPKIHDLGRDFEARPYFAMSFVAGKTLREILTTSQNTKSIPDKQFELLQRVDILIHVAEILDFVHSRNIAHCDLKPENIIVGENDTTHVVDWGLATILQHEHIAESSGPSFAERRGRQGSPLYMSPEQAALDAPLCAATDIYSLGVSLYECLTFETPFCADSVEDALREIVTTDPEPPRQRARDQYIPAALEQICLKAMSKRVEERHPSMAEFAAELRDCRLDLLIDYERDEATQQYDVSASVVSNFDQYLVYV
jgi:eukaryotic-like serine/threonine-protein kinase